MTVLEELFAEISQMLEEKADEGTRNSTGEGSEAVVSETYAINELIYYTENDEPLMIEFSLFAESMLLLLDGTVYVTDDDHNEWEIVDKGMLSAVTSFLKWRSKILKQLEL